MGWGLLLLPGVDGRPSDLLAGAVLEGGSVTREESVMVVSSALRGLLASRSLGLGLGEGGRPGQKTVYS